MLNDRVIPFFDSQEVKLLRVLTDRGSEYCGNPERHEYELYLAIEDIDHSRTKAKSPQTNGICERFHKTVLNEFYRVAFRKKVYRSIDELQADLDLWIREYNEQRPHQGRWCFGKTPMQTFLDAMPMAKEVRSLIAIGHENPIAQPATACQIEFRLIHLSRAVGSWIPSARSITKAILCQNTCAASVGRQVAAPPHWFTSGERRTCTCGTDCCASICATGWWPTLIHTGAVADIQRLYPDFTLVPHRTVKGRRQGRGFPVRLKL